MATVRDFSGLVAKAGEPLLEPVVEALAKAADSTPEAEKVRKLNAANAAHRAAHDRAALELEGNRELTGPSRRRYPS